MTLPGPATRALAYVRLSRDTDASTSPERQQKEIEEYVSRRGWELVEVIQDIHQSATRMRLDRPGIRRIRELFAEDDQLVVVVARLDRVARNVRDLTELADEGIRITSATEPYDTSTSDGLGMAQIQQIFAQMEVSSLKARVKSMRGYLPSVARWPGGKLPYGYTTAATADGRGRTLTPHPEESQVVRRMVDMVLAGTSLTQVASSLTMAGIRTRVGTEWSPSSIARLLRHGTIRGYATLHGDYIYDERGLPAQVWPELVTSEEARALDRALKRRPPEARLPAGGQVPLLHGIAHCSSCMRPLTPRHFGRDDRAALYACQSRNRGRVCARPQTVTAAPAEEEASRQFLVLWGGVEILETVEEAREPEGLAEVAAALEEAQSQITRRGADVMAVADRIMRLGAERARLEALPRTAAVRRPTGLTYGQKWEKSRAIERRDLMRAANAFVLVHPAKAKGHWDPERIEMYDELVGALD